MKFKHEKEFLEEKLSYADIKINGNRKWDLQVNNPEFYSKIIAGGSLFLGESYVNNWWNCESLDEFFYRILKNKLDELVKFDKNSILLGIKSKIVNMQRKSKAFDVGIKHYDIGNDLYENMLDRRMVYSCGYWKNANNLDRAQEDKLELVCNKIQLKPGMKVLDIGCGWGSFAKYSAEKYGVEVLGITVSKEQIKYAKENSNGLPIHYNLQDYRELNGKFDRIVSIGMFEHVRYKNYRRFFEVVKKNLKDNGLFLLQTIGSNNSVTTTDPWINKYIFPNSMTPSAKQITNAVEGLLNIEDWHNFGIYYDNTLMAWYKNFINNWNVLNEKYDYEFKRMWEYYLSSCAGNFRTGEFPLWQIVFSKKGLSYGYTRVR